MSFVQPLMLGIAGLAVGLPLLIHFLTRPRPIRYPLSTVRFVRQAVAQKKSRHRLRDVLVLLLRMAAIGLLGWAFARPLLDAQARPDVDANARVRRVVVLDVSQSMGASSSGISRFELARAQATQFLRPRIGLAANLIFAGAQPRPVFDRLSSSFSVLTEQLDQSRVTAERANVQEAINEAARMLADGAPPDSVPELIVISDFQRSNWGAADFAPLPTETSIRLESVAERTLPGNLAILSARFTGRLTSVTESELAVVVANHSASAATIQCAVTLANTAVTLHGTCGPNATTTLTQSIGLHEPGWIQGVARLVNHSDALPQDDVCPLVGLVQAAPTIGMVTREPPSQKQCASWYLERAIAPYTGEQAARLPRIERIDPARLALQSIGQCQLLLLVRPGKLETEQIALLAAWLRRGRSLLYVTTELVDANNFRQLADALGQELQPPVELLPTLRGADRSGLTIASVPARQRPFSVFGDGLQAVLAGIRIHGGLATRRAPNALDEDVLATLNDRSMLLFTSTVGAGSLGILNADLGESNLALQPAFVPLVAELVDQLLPGDNAQTTAYCGEPLARLLPPEAVETSELSTVLRPVESLAAAVDEPAIATAGVLSESASGVVWRWDNPTAPGVAAVLAGEKPVYSLALKAPAEETDLRSLNATVFTERLAGGREIRFRQATAPKSNRDAAWIWFAAACVAAMIAEVLTLRMFRM